MQDDSPPDSADRFNLRLPPGLRERVRVAAEANGRSMNSEIVACISAALDGGGQVDVDELAERIVRGLVARLASRPQPNAKRGRKR